MDAVKELFDFYNNYSGEKGFLGQTELKIPIPYFDIVKTERPIIFMQGAIHGREYITSHLLIKEVEYLNAVLSCGRVIIAPMINIDGVKLALKDFRFKCNARGVDLNTNFPARFGEGASNKFVRGFSDYVGKAPLSESESRALYHFTTRLLPDATFSFHAKGEEIYYDFFDEDLALKHSRFADALAQKSGYKIRKGLLSCGGYKDYVLSTLRCPSFTVEVGSDSLSHPINRSCSYFIFEKVKDFPNVVIDLLTKQNG